MRLRAVRPFRWAGEHVEPGTLLDVAAEGSSEPRGPLTVSAREARVLLTYGDVEAIDEPAVEQRPSGLVVGNADPVVEHRDPIAAPHRKGRRS